MVDFAKSIKPSLRGELERTDLNNIYLSKGKLKVSILRSGTTWLDTGTHNSLMDASLFVRTIENRQGTPIGSPEAVAFKNGWIEGDDVMKLISEYPDDHGYKKLLIRFVEEQ